MREDTSFWDLWGDAETSRKVEAIAREVVTSKQFSSLERRALAIEKRPDKFGICAMRRL